MTRTQLEELAKWHEHQLTFLPDSAKVNIKLHKDAAAAIRELLAQEPVAWLQRRFVDSRPADGHETCEPTDYGAFAVYAYPVPAVDQIVGPFDSVDDLIAALPGPAVDLAEWKTEAMRLVDELMSECRQTGEAEPGSRYYDLTGPEKERKLRAALQSHLDKIGGK
jgi:hypothetical protein